MNLLWQANFTNPWLPYDRIIKIYIKESPRTKNCITSLVKKCSLKVNSHRSVQGSIQLPLIAPGAKYCVYCACLDWWVTSVVWYACVCACLCVPRYELLHINNKRQIFGKRTMRKKINQSTSLPPSNKMLNNRNHAWNLPAAWLCLSGADIVS